jgi:hypothetical protein
VSGSGSESGHPFSFHFETARREKAVTEPDVNNSKGKRRAKKKELEGRFFSFPKANDNKSLDSLVSPRVAIERQNKARKN